MASTSGEVRQVYKALLKAVNTNITSYSGNTVWRDEIVRQFKSNISADQDSAKKMLNLAKDYLFYVKNIKHHRDLLRSYNIGLEEHERNKRMVEATASRVGFRLPVVEASVGVQPKAK